MHLLVVKTSALGDVVQALHALGGFSQYLKNSNTQLEWVVERSAAPLVALHPFVNLVHVIDTKKWRSHLSISSTYQEIWDALRRLRASHYDAALDLQGNVKSAAVIGLVKADRKVGYSSTSAAERPASWVLDEKLDVGYKQGVRVHYQEMFAHAFQQKAEQAYPQIQWRWDLHKHTPPSSAFGIMALGSRWPNKQIDVGLVKKMLTEILQNRYESVFLAWGSEEEKKLCKLVVESAGSERVHMMPKSNLTDFAAWVSRAHWMISADSLPLHLAALFAIPTFSVFGPSSGALYAPNSPKDSHWQGQCPYNEVFEKRCPHLRSCSTGQCLRSKSQEAALEALNRWICEID